MVVWRCLLHYRGNFFNSISKQVFQHFPFLSLRLWSLWCTFGVFKKCCLRFFSTVFRLWFSSQVLLIQRIFCSPQIPIYELALSWWWFHSRSSSNIYIRSHFQCSTDHFSGPPQASTTSGVECKKEINKAGTLWPLFEHNFCIFSDIPGKKKLSWVSFWMSKLFNFAIFWKIEAFWWFSSQEN